MASFEDVSFVEGDGKYPPVNADLWVEMNLTSGITDGKKQQENKQDMCMYMMKRRELPW